MRCPICDKTFEPTTSDAQPFCGKRCQTIDLGRWLGEVYGMPAEFDPDSIEMPDENDAGHASRGGQIA
jgi:hypothetical protein